MKKNMYNQFRLPQFMFSHSLNLISFNFHHEKKKMRFYCINKLWCNNTERNFKNTKTNHEEQQHFDSVVSQDLYLHYHSQH